MTKYKDKEFWNLVIKTDILENLITEKYKEKEKILC